jgi:N-acetylmuramoyl-L-alanine amidase
MEYKLPKKPIIPIIRYLLFFTVLLFCLFLPMSVYAADTVQIIGSSVNVRQGPGTSYDKIATVSQGSEFALLLQSGGWYKISLSDGQTGWVTGDYAVLVPDSNANMTAPATPTATVTTPDDFSKYKQGMVNTSVLNMRQGPGTSYASVAKLSQGTGVAIYEAQGAWYKVFALSYGWGWVSSDYITLKDIKISSISTEQENDDEQPGNTGDGVAGKLIYIDPGHGTYNEQGILDQGASGYGLLEKDIAYAISVKVRDLLLDLGAEVVMTRGQEPITLNLYQRAAMANEAGANVFVSIHTNSFTNPSANGTSSWFYAPVDNFAYDREARALLAQIMQKNMVSATGLSNYGVREANFAVTRETYMPSVLLETAFISNPDDNAYLASESGQAALAQGIVNGLVEYFSQ